MNHKYISEKKDILKNHGITKGYFISYDKIGGTGNPYITYSYIVNNVEYRNQVPGLTKYEYCYKNNCTDKIFWVLYSPENPENSLIDLTKEIQDITQSVFPLTLDNFR